MIINVNVSNNIEINCLTDLVKLNMEGIKINKSKIARELGSTRKTVKKYIEGFNKSTNRKRKSKLDSSYEKIYDLLHVETKENQKVFHYKRNLYNYCIEKKIIENISEGGFKHWLSNQPKLNKYFKTSKSKVAQIRFETGKGEQAQLDWKESMTLLLKNKEQIEVNVFVLLLSYSRFRYYGISLSKTQDILFNFLDNAFELFGGVPNVLLTDNMKTVMDVPRTEYSKGKINNKFQMFADDYGFQVQPCIAGRPQTKAKVEQPMRILDYLKAFNGELSYDELVNKVKELNDKENTRYHEGYGLVPIFSLQKEKDSLKPIPKASLRNHYKITSVNVKVDNSSLISYKSNKYAVPPEYLYKTLKLQVHDNKLHLYYNTKLITVHNIVENSKGNLIYTDTTYKQILEASSFKFKHIEDTSTNNLKKIGEKFNDRSSNPDSKSSNIKT